MGSTIELLSITIAILKDGDFLKKEFGDNINNEVDLAFLELKNYFKTEKISKIHCATEIYAYCVQNKISDADKWLSKAEVIANDYDKLRRMDLHIRLADFLKQIIEGLIPQQLEIVECLIKKYNEHYQIADNLYPHVKTYPFPSIAECSGLSDIYHGKLCEFYLQLWKNNQLRFKNNKNVSCFEKAVKHAENISSLYNQARAFARVLTIKYEDQTLTVNARKEIEKCLLELKQIDSKTHLDYCLLASLCALLDKHHDVNDYLNKT